MTATLLLGACFVVGTVLLVLACYGAMRWVMGGGADDERKDLASSVIARVSALHGLILSLVFAQQMFEYQGLRHDTAAEAAAIADLYFDVDRYDPSNREAIQTAVRDYTAHVITIEWQALAASGRLTQRAWDLWNDAYLAVLDLEPGSPRQQALRDNMLSKLHDISALRNARGSHGALPLSPMFWFAALSGVVLSAMAYHHYTPSRENLLLLSIFGAFTGIIVFLIYSFSNPYAPPGALRPTSFERVLEQEMG